MEVGSHPTSCTYGSWQTRQLSRPTVGLLRDSKFWGKKIKSTRAVRTFLAIRWT